MVTQEIKLRIYEESDLFSSLDPDQVILSEDVISYLNRKYEVMYRMSRGKEQYVIHIFTDTPVNENRVKEAIREHCLQERENLRFITKIETFKELTLGIFGLVILTAWYLLSDSWQGVFLEVLTIIGWVAIWEVAGSALLRRPELYHHKKVYDLALQSDIVIEVSPHGRS